MDLMANEDQLSPALSGISYLWWDRQQLFIQCWYNVALSWATIQLPVMYYKHLRVLPLVLPLAEMSANSYVGMYSTISTSYDVYLYSYHIVVIWSNVLGDIQWRKDSLSWGGPPAALSDARYWTEIEQTTECSLPRWNVSTVISSMIKLLCVHTEAVYLYNIWY